MSKEEGILESEEVGSILNDTTNLEQVVNPEEVNKLPENVNEEEIPFEEPISVHTVSVETGTEHNTSSAPLPVETVSKVKKRKKKDPKAPRRPLSA